MTKTVSRFTSPVSARGLALALLGLTFALTPALADVLATSYSNPGNGLVVYSGTPSAQQFTLLSSVIITSVDVAFEGTSSVNVLTMTIVSDSGNLPAGTLQATDSSDSGSTTSSAFSDVNFAFSSPMLSAGTYWLVISTTASVSAGEKWQDQSTLSTPAGEGGSIDGRLASNGATVNGFAFLTTINGSLATSTPEPTTIVTSLAALAAILLWRTKTA